MKFFTAYVFLFIFVFFDRTRNKTEELSKEMNINTQVLMKIQPSFYDIKIFKSLLYIGPLQLSEPYCGYNVKISML